MPREKSSMKELLKKWVSEDRCFTTDGKTVFCTTCNKQVHCQKKFQLHQHKGTEQHNKHRQTINEKSQSLIPNVLSGSGSKKNEFYKDLSQAMIAVNMPWRSLNNVVFRQFLEKYTSRIIPDESTLRKGYLQGLYDSVINNIREDVGNNFVWLGIDETADAEGRYIANIIFGKFSPDGPTKTHLLATKQLHKVNFETVAKLTNDSIRILWPGEDPAERVILLVSDAAPYMIKAEKLMKAFFPDMIHVTCLAHGLHRVAEEIRKLFPLINELISQTKMVFAKAPLRIQKYKERLPDVPVPPNPVITRWGTWPRAAVFYHKYFEQLKEIVAEFDANASVSIQRAQDVMNEKNLRNNLSYMAANFSIIESSITKLETTGTLLTESLSVVQRVKESMETVHGSQGKTVADKLKQVLANNPGYKEMLQIADVLNGKCQTVTEVRNISAYKYAPVTSCDVERSFSAFKLILTDKRRSFSVENLEKLLIVYFHNNYFKSEEES